VRQDLRAESGERRMRGGRTEEARDVGIRAPNRGNVGGREPPVKLKEGLLGERGAITRELLK
jgi:hypothetical protein